MIPEPSCPAPPPEPEDDRLDPLVVNLERHGLDESELALRGQIANLLARADARGTMSPRHRRQLELDIRQLCYLHNLPEVLALSGVPLVYNFGKQYAENYLGPWDRIPDRDGITRGRRWSLMGLDIGFPIGIPASVLTANARWIDYYARQGFNVITYKTVRSRAKAALDYPNWVYLEDLDRPVDIEKGMPSQVTGDQGTFFADPDAFSTANSFGVPSEEPEVWKRDVARTISNLRDGKLLIVSIMGTAEDPRLQEPAALAGDYAAVARHAVEAGAPAIEINLSCPNTLASAGKNKPPVCEDAALTEKIVHRVADELDRLSRGTRIVCKFSWMRREPLGELIGRFAERIHGVSGINTMAVPVTDRQGDPTFGERSVAGVSGVGIRDFGRDFVRSVGSLRHEHRWELALIGMGGVMNASDVRELLDAGADAVQTATAASHNPTLPLAVSKESEGELSGVAQMLLGLLAHERQHADLVTLASDARLAVSTVRAGLLELERRGHVVEAYGDDRPTYVLGKQALAQALG
jgi:dihydroorotate dehydrogenase